jgi:hypothetical protein
MLIKPSYLVTNDQQKPFKVYTMGSSIYYIISSGGLADTQTLLPPLTPTIIFWHIYPHPLEKKFGAKLFSGLAVIMEIKVLSSNSYVWYFPIITFM